jgi:transposase
VPPEATRPFVKKGKKNDAADAAALCAAASRPDVKFVPSELRRPPSNAAVTFLRPTDGSENGSRLLSIMAGVAASDSVRGWLR